MVDAQAMLERLGITPDDLRWIDAAPALEEAQRRLEDLKQRVRRDWKRRVFELHPDRNNGDPAKAAELAEMNAAMSRFEKLTIQVRPKPVRVPRVIIIHQTAGWSNSSSATTSSTFSGGWPFFR